MLCSLRNDKLSGDKKTPSPMKRLSLLCWLLAATSGANQLAYSTTRPSAQTLGHFFYPLLGALPEMPIWLCPFNDVNGTIVARQSRKL